MEPITLYTRQTQQTSAFQPFRPDSAAGPVRRETDPGAPRSVVEQKEKLREAAKDFEAIFVRQLLKNMRSTLMDGGMFGDGTAGEIYSDMMENALAEKISETGSLGLGEQLYRRLVTRIDSAEGAPIAVPTAEIPKEVTTE